MAFPASTKRTLPPSKIGLGSVRKRRMYLSGFNTGGPIRRALIWTPAGTLYLSASVKLIILYDNTIHTSGTRSDWGFSCLIEKDDHILAANAKTPSTPSAKPAEAISWKWALAGYSSSIKTLSQIIALAILHFPPLRMVKSDLS